MLQIVSIFCAALTTVLAYHRFGFDHQIRFAPFALICAVVCISAAFAGPFAARAISRAARLTFQKIVQAIVATAGIFAGVVTSTFEGIARLLSATVNGLIRAITAFFNGIANAITALFKGMANAITAVFKGIAQTITAFFQAIAHAITSFSKALVDATAALADGLIAGLEAVGRGIQKAATFITVTPVSFVARCFTGVSRDVAATFRSLPTFPIRTRAKFFAFEFLMKQNRRLRTEIDRLHVENNALNDELKNLVDAWGAVQSTRRPAPSKNAPFHHSLTIQNGPERPDFIADGVAAEKPRSKNDFAGI